MEHLPLVNVKTDASIVLSAIARDKEHFLLENKPREWHNILCSRLKTNSG
jgi:hypothetical protein